MQTCLQWNSRTRQKAFVVVEGNNELPRKEKEDLFACLRPSGEHMVVKQREEDDEEGDGFDLIPWTEQELERESSQFNKMKSKM